MNTTIYKYPLPVDDSPIIDMPMDARVLCVQVQNGQPFIWAMVNPEYKFQARGFEVRGTAHPLNGSEGRYIGTFQLSGGALVFHVFEHSRGAC